MVQRAQPAQETQTPAGFGQEQQSAGQRAGDADQTSGALAVAQQRERLLRQIAEDIRSAASVEEAVERAITALGREVGASEVVVRLGTEAELLSFAARVGASYASHS
jgi:hypothetical protein